MFVLKPGVRQAHHIHLSVQRHIFTADMNVEHYEPDLVIFSSSSRPSSSKRSLISATAFRAMLKEKSGLTVTLGMTPSSVGVHR